MSSVIALIGVLWTVLSLLPKQFPILSYVPSSYSVSGNGSTSVMVDDYLYYVNGIISINDIGYKDNEYYPNGQIPPSSIYRVHIKPDGKPDITYLYAEDDVSTTDIDESETIIGVKSGPQCVVPKIAGTGDFALFVFGDTLIYTTPNNQKNKNGIFQVNRTDFFSVKLDGSNNTRLYTTDNDVARTDFSVVFKNGVFIFINDGGVLKRIDMNGNVNVIAEDVSSVKFPEVYEYGRAFSNSKESAFNGVMNYVYYTKAREESDSKLGNLMYRVALDTRTVDTIGDDGDLDRGVTFTPISVSNNKFLFTSKDSNDALTHLIEGKEDKTQLPVTSFASSVPSFYIAENKVFFILNSNLYSLNPSSTNHTLVASGFDTPHVTLISNDKIYINSNNLSLLVLNYDGSQSGSSVDISNITTGSLSLPIYFDAHGYPLNGVSRKMLIFNLSSAKVSSLSIFDEDLNKDILIIS
jgi:hypothetical protein